MAFPLLGLTGGSLRIGEIKNAEALLHQPHSSEILLLYNITFYIALALINYFS